VARRGGEIVTIPQATALLILTPCCLYGLHKLIDWAQRSRVARDVQRAHTAAVLREAVECGRRCRRMAGGG
jgi:hypothetical protein